jgi:hypothetical protein
MQIQHKANGLEVIDNGKSIASLPGVFLSTARYNLYTFSRYKGINRGDNKNDGFYLKEIRTMH